MTYLVAKANPTATAFVAKATNEKPGWIIVARRVPSYPEALKIRDKHNSERGY
jgi:hypothetical protein